MDKMIEAFRVQWALIKMLAIAGGAEAVKDYPDDPEFLDQDWRLPGPREELVRTIAESQQEMEDKKGTEGGDEE